MQNGFPEVYNLSGGLKTFETASQKQSNEDIFENDYIRHDDHIYQGSRERTRITPVDTGKLKDVDACGLQCPGPVLKLKKAMDLMTTGEAVRIRATDAGFYKDVKAWANVTGNQVVDLTQDGAEITAIVRKGEPAVQVPSLNGGNNTTLICFSDDLDKALATFVIANGAIASGKKVNGVELIACQMSMDVMGIKAEELMDGVQIGGVATYLERTESSNLNLFV